MPFLILFSILELNIKNIKNAKAIRRPNWEGEPKAPSAIIFNLKKAPVKTSNIGKAKTQKSRTNNCTEYDLLKILFFNEIDFIYILFFI